MHVVMAAAEAVPFAKTGGLADVLGALPRALQRLGVDVTVVLPAYAVISRRGFSVQRLDIELEIPIANRILTGGVLATTLHETIPVYLIEAEQYFDRAGLYGTPSGDYPDNAERFAFFGRAIPALLQHLGAPHILHCHDWQTALAPVFLRLDAARYPSLVGVKTVQTVHNLGYQGLFERTHWPLLNLDWRYFTADWLEFYGRINYLKGGLVAADALTTVSPTYAREIQTRELGYGLEGLLRQRRSDLLGILNGVDYRDWNPEHDPFIAARYSANDPAGKLACKVDLQQTIGLPCSPKTPLIGIVSRLAAQKGFDLLAEVVPAMLQRHNLQLAILGTGDDQYARLLGDLRAQFPRQLAVRIGFDEPLAHKIEAGSDIFLMPSRYEPCGLNQIYSLRYGTVPVVHATGGLEDTIAEFDHETGSGTGFKFKSYTASALRACLERALDLYGSPDWPTIRRNGMRADFSWDRSAQAYMDLYRRIRPDASLTESLPITAGCGNPERQDHAGRGRRTP
ncbi:glycogen synthase GlgA [Candidatus Binatia bacterium]|nr:glycogen synthase GlgA [Candidatus Binatia bacterium]